MLAHKFNLPRFNSPCQIETLNWWALHKLYKLQALFKSYRSILFHFCDQGIPDCLLRAAVIHLLMKPRPLSVTCGYLLIKANTNRPAGAQSMSPTDTNQAHSTLDQEYILKFNPTAMTRLSLGTGLLVSTVLTIPDTIAILPTTHDIAALGIRVTGLWLSVFVQWCLAFLGILHAAALINRGIIVGPENIRLNRFSKPIDWSNIAGIAGEPRPLISKLMFLKQPAMRFQLFVKHQDDIKVKNLDSLFFSQSEFSSLVNVIAQSSFGFAPQATQVLIIDREKEKLKKAYKRAGAKSKLITAYIAVMLMLFIGRGAARNYFYNEAGQYFNQANYLDAKRFCETSLAIDGTYPFALDRLARCEFRMKDATNAETHWKKALQMKPDLVSAKVGLSNIYMQRKDFDAAENVLTNALRLEPRDIPVHLNLGHLYIQRGERKRGLEYFEKALRFSPDNATVKLLAAQAYLSDGAKDKALNLITSMNESEVEPHNRLVYAQVKEKLHVPERKSK